jgi:hypothetical protein
VNTPHGSHLLFPLFQPAHRAHRRVAGLVRGKTLRDAFLDLVFQVEPELLVELPLHRSAAQDGPQPQRHREPPAFHPHV